jgi:hypothetical protein
MTPRQIVEKLETVIGLSDQPRRLVETIEEILKNHLEYVPIRAAEEAEKLEQAVRRLVEQNRVECETIGLIPPIVISSHNERAVCGSCWIETSDSPAIRAAKKRRLQVEPIVQAIQELTFTQFEQFGAAILSEIGAKSVRVTPHANDQGIDFYGILNIGDLGRIPLPFEQLAHDVTIRFVGQAKHYPSVAIGPSVVREFVGAILLAKHQIHTTSANPFGDLYLLALHPLLGMVFTTGRFTSGAIRLAKRAGLLTRSVEQLSVFLADRGVGYSGPSFSRNEFHQWLNG